MYHIETFIVPRNMAKAAKSNPQSERKKLTKFSEEVFSNNKYSQVPSLKGIIDPTSQDLSEILSIKMNAIETLHPVSKEYFIDTKNYSYWITTQQWLDLVFVQIDKKSGESTFFSPYSSAGYPFFAMLLLGYYHFFKKIPRLNFLECDFEEWNELSTGRRGWLPLGSEMQNFYRDPTVYNYLFHEDFFKKEEDNIYRLYAHHDFRAKDGLWFTDKELIVKITHSPPSWKEIGPLEFHIDKNILLLLLQAYVDVNRYVSGSLNNLNVLKIKQALAAVLLGNKDLRTDDDKGTDVLSEHLFGGKVEPEPEL